MTESTASLNRFAITHQAHGGRLQLVPKDGGGREWVECCRCGARRIVAPPDRRDDGHGHDSIRTWRR